MCPVCGEAMVVFEFEGTDIDRCVQCGGTWMDTGEIEMLGAFGDAAAGGMSATLAAAAEICRTRRRCPRCPRRLREVTIGTRPKITLDRCPWGHGVWFDRGEMLALIHAFDGDPLGPATRFFADLYRHEVDQTEGGGG